MSFSLAVNSNVHDNIFIARIDTAIKVILENIELEELMDICLSTLTTTSSTLSIWGSILVTPLNYKRFYNRETIAVLNYVCMHATKMISPFLNSRISLIVIKLRDNNGEIRIKEIDSLL